MIARIICLFRGHRWRWLTSPRSSASTSWIRKAFAVVLMVLMARYIRDDDEGGEE